nr:hypothetical protein [Candidatus Sigynarchaeum springense]
MIARFEELEEKEIEEKLDAMLFKGGLMGYHDDNDQKKCCIAFLVSGMFEFQFNKITKVFPS